MRWKRVTDGLAYLLVRLLICLVQSLRIETCEVAARWLAFMLSEWLPLRRSVIDENLANAFPTLEASQRRRLARRMWEHLLLMVCEIAQAPRRIHRRNWHQHVTIHHKRELVRYLLEPRPIVLVSGHFGNFEMGGFITGLLGFPTFTVARPLDNPHLDAYINRFRGSHGQFILPKQGSAPQIQAVLAAGAALTLLGDQFAGPKGCWVDFLGRPASCHKAIALFTLTSGAPLLVVSARRAGGPLRFDVDLLGVLDPASPCEALSGVVPLTQWYNARLEEAIRRDPEQYWWVHRRWKGTPPRWAMAGGRAA